MERPSQIIQSSMENIPQIKNFTLQDFVSALGNLSLSVQDEFKSKICKQICDKLWVAQLHGKSLYFKAESKHELIRKMSASNEFREILSSMYRYEKDEVNTIVFKGPPAMFVCVVCGIDPKGNFKHSHSLNELNDAHWFELTEDLYKDDEDFFKKVELSEEMLHRI